MPTALRTLLMVVTLWSVNWVNASGQLLRSPVNTALGGGGTAYTTGYEALLINPANLLIREKEYRYQFSTTVSGAYISSPVKHRHVSGYREHFLNQTDGYEPLISSDEIDYSTLINRNYARSKMMPEHLTSGEIHWFGMHWSHPDRSYAIAVRTRFSNRYSAGRAYFDPEPVGESGNTLFNRSLLHRHQSFHELAVGYAESFDFINGLLPRISRLMIGISPKLIASGSYLDLTFHDTFREIPAADDLQHNRSYQHLSTGVFTGMHQRYAMQQDPYDPPAGRFDLFRPTGIGAGLNAGLTYLITLGDDLSAINTSAQTRKSLRLSFSVTDLGVIHYYQNPEKHQRRGDVAAEDELPGLSDRLYLGRPGEHIEFLEQNESHPLAESADIRNDSFSVLLPTALQGGVLIQMSRFKLMADMSLGLTDNAFNSTRLVTYIGTEIRPLPFLPLRAGTRISRENPDYYSIGAGIETRYAELSAAVQFRSRSIGPTNEISGISIGALKIYIP